MRLLRKGSTKKNFDLATNNITVVTTEDNLVRLGFTAAGGRGTTDYVLLIEIEDMPSLITTLSTCIYNECARPARDLTVPELLEILKRKMGYVPEPETTTED